MNSEEIILDLVCKECKAIGLKYTPDVIINGPDGFYGEDAEDLIYNASKIIGLSRQDVDRIFPYSKYFIKEETLSLIPLRIIKWFFSRRNITKTPPPLTAHAFAILLVEIHKKANFTDKIMGKS